MGGGGSYYDRDTTARAFRTVTGASSIAEEKMSRSRMDPALSPKDRVLNCESENPIVFLFDVTGSMGTLPQIIYDKMPMIAGQIIDQKYVADPQISLGAIGDEMGDQAPIQVADFVKLRKMDEWLQRIWIEGEGGGQHFESYELMLWYYLNRCNLPKAKNPILLITGDEDFRETMPAGTLNKLFGGQNQGTTAKTVIRDLLAKFNGNMILIHRTYSDGELNKVILSDWRQALGKERVLELGSGTDADLSIGDVSLGVIAMLSGSRTLEEYCQDMRKRINVDTGKPEPQSENRIGQVRRTLEPLTAIVPKRKRASSDSTATPSSVKKPSGTKAGSKKPNARRPGRL